MRALPSNADWGDADLGMGLEVGGTGTRGDGLLNGAVSGDIAVMSAEIERFVRSAGVC